jgi:uncharacterized protein
MKTDVTAGDQALQPLCERLEAVLSAHDDGSDGSHDVHHSRRVLRMALRIARAEGGGDAVTLACAAYLHDLVNLPKNHPDRSRASALSAEAARPILRDLGIDEARIEAACHAIETHSFSAGKKPQTLEARILQDADRIEALGAIGIARAFYIAGMLGSSLFDGGDPLAEHRPLDDKKFALDHFEVKLWSLATTMQTDAGRRLAQERTQYMRDFVAQLVGELRD